jgi:tight adherence protein B
MGVTLLKEIMFLLMFITIAVIIYSILRVAISRGKHIYRLGKYVGVISNSEKEVKSEFKLMQIISFLSKAIKDMAFLDTYREKVQIKLIKAHILLKAEEYIIIRIIITAVFVTLPNLTGKPLIYSIILGGTGWLLPSTYINIRISSRIKQFSNSLGDAVMLISNSMKAGYSFFQSLDIVAKEMVGPLAEEFEFLQKEINLGYTTEEALDNLLKRVKSDDLELVITAVLIQRQVGGNLAEVLDSISSTIRDRIRIKGEIRTITAQGRISGIMIAILPPGLGIVLFIINPEHMRLLFTDRIGLIMIGISIVMELMGIYTIKKIVQIEV